MKQVLGQLSVCDKNVEYMCVRDFPFCVFESLPLSLEAEVQMRRIQVNEPAASVHLFEIYLCLKFPAELY